jgi:hypothetical protein
VPVQLETKSTFERFDISKDRITLTAAEATSCASSGQSALPRV